MCGRGLARHIPGRVPAWRAGERAMLAWACEREEEEEEER